MDVHTNILQSIGVRTMYDVPLQRVTDPQILDLQAEEEKSVNDVVDRVATESNATKSSKSEHAIGKQTEPTTNIPKGYPTKHALPKDLLTSVSL